MRFKGKIEVGDWIKTMSNVSGYVIKVTKGILTIVHIKTDLDSEASNGGYWTTSKIYIKEHKKPNKIKYNDILDCKTGV